MEQIIPAQRMIGVVHFTEVLVRIRWNVSELCVLCMILYHLHAEQEHSPLTICIPVFLLVFQDPDYIT